MVPRHDIRAALVDASLVRMLYEPFTQSSVHRVPLARAHHVSYVCYERNDFVSPLASPNTVELP
eukprot:176287-Prymnesium_polylepis.1